MGASYDVEDPDPVATIEEEPVTPAVGKDLDSDVVAAEENQKEARSRLRGIRSTYNRFSTDAATSGENGTKTNLG